MADEVEMTPVEMTPVAPEPPKANPLGGTTGVAKTLKLAPAVRKPIAGATGAALKPGLKLPTQNALRPGIKLPPKPGATVSALKPGLKLPPKPGATVSALKPGVKLPAKPMIRKPGEGAPAASALPKPVLPKPVVPVDAQGVGKLPTVEATPVARAGVPAPDLSAQPKPMEQLKTVTQKLKGITQQIPQQAILRKTGIIAEGAMTDAQKEAAKHKTARISLSDAMGVAPVKSENAPMKTIRIKRPIDIPGATPAAAAPAAPAPAPAPAPAAATSEPAAPAAAETSVTQRKTLKIARPGGGAVRPSGKFAVKRTGAPAPMAAKKPAAAPAAGGEVADIPDLPSVPAMPIPQPVAEEKPGFGTTLALIVQLAACGVIGAVAYFLYQNTQTQYF